MRGGLHLVVTHASSADRISCAVPGACLAFCFIVHINNCRGIVEHDYSVRKLDLSFRPVLFPSEGNETYFPCVHNNSVGCILQCKRTLGLLLEGLWTGIGTC